MSDRTQDLKNLRAVATACKNYVDETKEQILWQVGQYNITTQDDNTTAYQKVVPTGATRGKLKSIGFMSYKSENLAIFDDVAETTINGVKVKYQDGAVYLDGTASDQFKVIVQFKQPIYANKDYYIKLFTSGTTTATNPKAIGETSTDVRLLIPSTTTFNVAYNINYFWFSAGSGTVWTKYVVKPMIVSGSTEPTIYKQGFTGIRDSVITSVKSYGANLFDVSTIRYNYWAGNPSSEPTNYSTQYIPVTPSTSYYISGTIGTYHLVQCYDANKTFVSTLINNNTTRTFTIPNNAYYIMYSANTGNGHNNPSTIMISIGSTTPTSYKAYRGLIDTFTIPDEVQALDGYGRGINENCYNVLNLDTKEFTDKDKRVDLGSFDYTAQYGGFYGDVLTDYQYNYVVNTTKFLCSYYNEYKYNNSLSDFFTHDKSITFSNTRRFWINDSQYAETSASDFKNEMNGKKFQYELATYNITDNLELPDNVIEVEEGGYLVFENQYQQAVPSNVTYRIEVAR